jgi:hypothetical protein
MTHMETAYKALCYRGHWEGEGDVIHSSEGEATSEDKVLRTVVYRIYE